MMDTLGEETLAFVERHKMPDGEIGEYRYSLSCTQPTLYSSTYAAMVRALYDDLGSLSESERRAWVDYLNCRQDRDGLFRDSVIYGQYAYKDDRFSNGRPHLTCHALTALTCLGAVAARPFTLVKEFARPGALEEWLGSRDWGKRVGWTGNEVLNLGTLLQYSRDFHNDRTAGALVDRMLDWLDGNYLSSDTGVWGTMDISDPINRSHAVQAAYHWWLLYFYDRRPIPHMERAIDTLLSTQNDMGSFGWGVHNHLDPQNGSACEDIDSIDPLARMCLLTDYRRDDIAAALERGLDWVLRNRTTDGGFAFMLGQPYRYGHPELNAEEGQGAMFPTWFRTLCIAAMGRALKDKSIGRFPWRFSDCPGIQFWRD